MVRQSFVVSFCFFFFHCINLLTTLFYAAFAGKDASSTDIFKDAAQDGGISGWRGVSERNTASSSAASAVDPYRFDAVVQQGDI